MAQVTGTDVQSSGGATSSFLAALRSGFGLEGVQSKVFADLLSQTASASSQPTARQDVAQGSDADASLATGSRASDIAADRAALRDMLQQMRHDAEALQAHHERARAARKDAKKDDAAPASDDATACVADAAASADKSEKTAAPSDDRSVDDTTVTAQAPTEEKDEVKTADDKDAVLATAATVDVKAPDSVTATQASVVTDDQALRADIAKIEQAVLALLNKIIREADAGEAQDAKDEVAATAAQIADVVGANPGAASPDKGKDKVASALMAAAASTDASSAQALTTGMSASNDNNGAADTGLSGSKDAGRGEAAPAKNAAQDKAFDFLSLFATETNTDTPPVNVPNAAVQAALKTAALPESGAARDGVAPVAAGAAPAAANPVTAEGVRPVGSYDFASQLSATRAANGGAAGLPSPVEQVALMLHKQVKDGNDAMTLQLRPGELGRIEIKLQFADDNTVQGTVIADNPATLDLLQKDSGALQRALQDAGLRADSSSLQFSLRDDGQAAFGQNQGQGANDQPASRAAADGFDSGAADEVGTASAVLETYYLTPGRVNLRV